MTSAAVRDLFETLRREGSFQEASRRLEQAGGQFTLSGLTTTAKAAYLVLLYQQLRHPLLVIVDGSKQAETLTELVETFFGILLDERDLPRPQMLPAFDVLPFQQLSPHTEISEQRAIALWRLASQAIPITIVPIAAALLRTESAAFYRQLALTLRMNDELPLEEIVQHLESIGYERREPVEMVGEYSVRGGILDVFPAEAEQPVRIEFFGDFIESLRRFDVESQRSVLKIEDVTLLPLLEQPKSQRLFYQLADVCTQGGRAVQVPGEPFPGWEFLVPLLRPREHSLFQLSARPPVVVWDEPEQTAGAAERHWQRLSEPGRQSPCPPDRIFFTWEQLREQAASLSAVTLQELALLDQPGQRSLHIPTRPAMAFHGNLQIAVAETRGAVERGHRVVFFGQSTGELERLADIFAEYKVPFQLALEHPEQAAPYLAERAYLTGSAASTYLVQGSVRKGVVFPESRLTLFGSEDLFDSSELVARPKINKSQLAAFQADLADVKPGDFVVHITHGVGKFLGVRTMPQGDFMLLEYAADAKLYVPLTRLDLVQKYRGAGEGHAPPLDRMGGATWAKTKSRVKAKMKDMADELIKLYAQRKMTPGFAFSPDSNWQREFEDAFEYTPTKDQVTAVAQIKRDMEAPHPMDRLLCGDVGFGKTEVAMRAAFKALGDGKQVALLAPTTVLTLQHFETLKRRFASFPVRMEMLSRFKSNKEIKAALEEIADGKVDIVIGTHRLLSQDVEFKDLGLLVIDEEQRFGVRHKERLKQLKKNVDVLTMSATPIPRTLHMALLGLRDMSVIETPPKDRLAIHTVVAHFDNELIRSAIDQELTRGGQVYFIHNRVDTIFMRAAAIQELLPQARIGVGHGQMGEADLEKVLLGFMRHDFDVLVCTTIAENGLDIPMANTIVIENAERYGLSELYQLRGRVGRSNRRAYAYLTIPSELTLSEIARKRLAALKEFSDLGAGFKIAALDLELRGAGNLLGGEQHGHIEAVGFDMYLRLLEEAVHELRGEEVPLEIHATLNLGLDLRIPQEYIADEHQRLRAYKRIADAPNPEQADRVLGELEDRYGPAPDAVRTLFRFAQIKNLAEKLGVEAIDRRQGFLNVKFHPEAKVDPGRLMHVIQQTPGAQFTPAGVLRLPVLEKQEPQVLLDTLAQSLQEAVPQPIA